MTTVDPNKHKCCALCNRWQGDANLTAGNPRGRVKFDVTKRGTCALGGRASTAAGDMSNCKDFVLSPAAAAFKM